MRVRVGDPPPPAPPITDGEPRWVRATRRAAVAAPPRSVDADVVVASEPETRETWLVDSFELVVPRYPWQKGRDSGP